MPFESWISYFKSFLHFYWCDRFCQDFVCWLLFMLCCGGCRLYWVGLWRLCMYRGIFLNFGGCSTALQYHPLRLFAVHPLRLLAVHPLRLLAMHPLRLPCGACFTFGEMMSTEVVSMVITPALFNRVFGKDWKKLKFQ